MIICIDSGNSRIKWGVHDGNRWLGQGALSHVDVAQLYPLLAPWGDPEKVMLANVAGVVAANAIQQNLAAWSNVWCEVRSEKMSCGVTSSYQNPNQLGVDRWCALIGARSLIRSSCVVVMAGTATTIDSLDETGCFLGGFILPGDELMRRALARETAGLPFANGLYAEFPKCTDDAIVSGAIEAQAGAIERAVRRLGGAAQCLVSGGNAEAIAKHCVVPVQIINNLPLEGLRRMAAES